jgi:hypothetical protein
MSAPRSQYLGGLIACAALGAVWITLHSLGFRIARENGLMENQQAACLSLAALTFAVAARRATSRATRCFAISLGLFCLMFLLRELELDRMRAPQALKYLFTGARRNLIILCLWTTLGAVGWKVRGSIWRTFTHWLGTGAGKLMLVAGALYGLTWPLDKEFLPLAKGTSMFVEELGDSSATLLICFSAALTLRLLAEIEASRPAGVFGKAALHED